MAEPTRTVSIASHDRVLLAADVWNESAVPTLLLMPAGGELRTVWRPVVAQLSPDVASRWRIVAADHRGHGDSGRSESYRFDQFLADLQCWIDFVAGAPLVLAGGSIGGALGLVAAGEGRKIEGLVLLDVPTVPVLDKVLAERARMERGVRSGHPGISQVDPRFIGSGFIEDVFADSDRWRRAACLLTIPTLLVTGAKGRLGPAAQEQFLRDIRHGEVATLNTGHLVARDDPRGVAGLIERFLAEHFDPL